MDDLSSVRKMAKEFGLQNAKTREVNCFTVVLDNCSSHPDIKRLTHVKLVFLPPQHHSDDSANGCWGYSLSQVLLQKKSG